MRWRHPPALLFQTAEQMVQPGCIASAEPMNKQFAAVGKSGRQRRRPVESISGARCEHALARAPTRAAVKLLVDENRGQVLNPSRRMMDKAFDGPHVDVGLGGAAPVDFRNIDIWQNVQKGLLPILAQRFDDGDGLPCFRCESLRR